jgi:hypothetical protein
VAAEPYSFGPQVNAENAEQEGSDSYQAKIYNLVSPFFFFHVRAPAFICGCFG